MGQVPTRQLLTVPAAAEYLGVSCKTVRRYVAGGRLQAYRLGPRMLRVDLDQVDRLLRAVPTTGSAA